MATLIRVADKLAHDGLVTCTAHVAGWCRLVYLGCEKFFTGNCIDLCKATLP